MKVYEYNFDDLLTMKGLKKFKEWYSVLNENMVREILIFFTSQIGMRCEVNICIDFFINDKGSVF